jgi:hypothetical protein
MQYLNINYHYKSKNSTIMNILDRLVINRISVSFILLILFFFIYPLSLLLFEGNIAIILPIIYVLILLAWITLSSFKKTRLVESGAASEGYKDLGEESGGFFRKGSFLEKLFAAFAMAIAILIVEVTILTILFYPFMSELAGSKGFPIIIAVKFLAFSFLSYLVVNRKLK